MYLCDMRTLEEIKKEVALDNNFNSWQILFESCAMYDYGRLEKAIKETAKRYATEVAHIIVNDALVKHGIGSNTSAEFVNKWIESNLPKH